jgi:hypothetical protein
MVSLSNHEAVRAHAKRIPAFAGTTPCGWLSFFQSGH